MTLFLDPLVRWYDDKDLTEDMFYPVLHVSCGKIHDAGNVEILARYADCTRWKCPHCSVVCDDRALGWGGNVRKLEKKN